MPTGKAVIESTSVGKDKIANDKRRYRHAMGKM
jgi:hypothetical protein